MTEFQCPEDGLVRLDLKEADASIQLSFDGNFLIILRELADESGVMRSDGSDIRVTATAEFSVAVAEGLCST